MTKRVRRVGQAVDDLDRPAQRSGRRRHHRRRAPDHLHDVVGHQDHAEGRQHLREVIALVELAHQQHFEQRRDDDGDEHRQRDGRDEGPALLVRLRRHVRPRHEQRAVRQVQHVHDAEHQRQARGQQEQHQPEAEPVEQLLKKKNTGHES
jgi:hypothetical protein